LTDQIDIGQTLFTVKEQESKTYEKNCPTIGNVLKGEGLNLQEKASSLYDQNFDFDFDVATFIDRLIKYSMVKYFLSKLMYGKFNINYLLSKYNKKFLNDLSHSKYKNFLDFFENPNSEVYGYNQYFL